MIRARPKSRIFSRPSRSRITFSGLRSRCAIPLRVRAGQRRRQLACGAEIVVADGLPLRPDLLARACGRRRTRSRCRDRRRSLRARRPCRCRDASATAAARASRRSRSRCDRIAHQVRRQRLERDGAARAACRSPGRRGPCRRVRARGRSCRRRRRRLAPAARRPTAVRARRRRSAAQKRAGARVVVDERQHFVAHDRIVGRFARRSRPRRSPARSSAASNRSRTRRRCSGVTRRLAQLAEQPGAGERPAGA